MMLSEPVFVVAVTHSQGISEAKVLLLSPPQQFWPQKKNIKTHSLTMGARQKPVPAAGKKPAAKKAANSKKPAAAKAAKAAGLKKPAAKAIKKPGKSKSKYEVRDLTEREKKIFEDYEVQEYNKRFKNCGFGKVSPRRTPASDSEGQ